MINHPANVNLLGLHELQGQDGGWLNNENRKSSANLRDWISGIRIRKVKNSANL